METVLLLLPFIQQLIANCQDKDRLAAGPDRRRLGRILIRRAAKKAGVPLGQRRDAVEEVLEEYDSMTAAEVDTFIAAARA